VAFEKSETGHEQVLEEFLVFWHPFLYYTIGLAKSLLLETLSLQSLLTQLPLKVIVNH